MTVFDRYVVVDWSASSTPKTGADSIWIADLANGARPRLYNPPTRHQAARYLDDVVTGEAGRTLIGVDASLGYPEGTAELLELDGRPWRAMWTSIAARSTDDERNRNNRFDVAADFNRLTGQAEGPFWGCPHDRFAGALRRTKPASCPVGEFRLVEQRLRAVGQYPKSCWQLLGAGSVGSQTLTVVPILHRLLDRVEVWPFTTGLATPDDAAHTVLAEVWPSLFGHERPIGVVADAAQVTGTAERLRQADRSGALRDWFAPQCSPAERTMVESEEGWILGPMSG